MAGTIVHAIGTKALSTLVTSVASTWLKPKLDELKKTMEDMRPLLPSQINNAYQTYLKKSYKKQVYINTIVFQNQQKTLNDIYIPLTISNKNRTDKYLIDVYDETILEKYKKIIIIDSAGMGKSTIMKKMFTSSIETNKGIPVFIELRKLKPGLAILDLICEELSTNKDKIDKNLFEKLIKRGDFIFFLDGYDEVQTEERVSITSALQKFISDNDNNYFILTSRPESALASFSDFQAFDIEPLSIKQAYSLLGKYDKDGETSKALKAKLDTDSTLGGIKEFLTNPLLTSLLFRAYEYKAVIPLKKHLFYQQVFESLFESHDLTKEGGFVRPKHSKLDIDDFRKALRALAFETFRTGKIELERDHFISAIENAQKLLEGSGIIFKPADLSKDLIATVPLFVKDGNYYRWSHKSIQEYFTAQFICQDTKEKQLELLSTLYHRPEVDKYVNLLDLCYDIDYKSFRHSIIKELLAEYIDYTEAYVETDKCEVDAKYKHERASALFTLCNPAVVDLGQQEFSTKDEEHNAAFQAGWALFPIQVQAIGTSRIAYRGPHTYFFAKISPKTFLLDLLSIKKDDLFSSNPDVEYSEGTFNKTLPIDNSPDSTLNNHHNYPICNKFIKHGRHNLIRLPEAKMLLDKINTEIENEKIRMNSIFQI